MTQQYNNALDSWYQDCPWPVQRVLESPYRTVSGWLRFVTGDPNKVAGYGPVYEAIGREVERLSGEIDSASAGMGQWTGAARDAYDAKMTTLKDSLSSLAPAITQTREILNAAAETSVEAANMILDIIRSVIEFLLSSLAVSAALAAFTFGASALAWVAANMAKGAHALAKVMQGLQKVAQVLQKIARALEKIASIMKKVAEILRKVKQILDAIKKAKKGATLIEKGILTGANALITMPINLAANGVLGGVSTATGIPGLSMPGGMGELNNARKDGTDAVQASNRAVDAANR